MSSDHPGEMADQCLEMMRSMGAMMSGADGHAGGMDGRGSMMGMGGMTGMGGGIGFLVLLLLLLLIVVGVAVLAFVLIRRRSSDGAADRWRALDELDRRYARGEVERDTYLQVRDDLREAHG